jgi:hypothetical protein
MTDADIKRCIDQVLAIVKPELTEILAMVRELAETQRRMNEMKRASFAEREAASLALRKLLATQVPDFDPQPTRPTRSIQ